MEYLFTADGAVIDKHLWWIGMYLQIVYNIKKFQDTGNILKIINFYSLYCLYVNQYFSNAKPVLL